MLSYRQSTDECGRPFQAEPGLGTEIKVKLSEWENGEMGLEKSRVNSLEKSLTADLAAWGSFIFMGAWTPTVALPLGSSVNLGSCSTSWG